MQERNFAVSMLAVVFGISVIGLFTSVALPKISEYISKRTFESNLKNFNDIWYNGLQRYSSVQGVGTFGETTLGTMGCKSVIDSNQRSKCVEYKATLNNTDTIVRFFKDYFRVSQVCDSKVPLKCLAESYSSRNKKVKWNVIKDISNHSGQFGCVMLDCGASLCYQSTQQVMVLDLNGPKGPNVSGRDLYFININSKRGNLGTKRLLKDLNLAKQECSEDSPYGYCFEYLMGNNWRMDY